MTPPFTDTQILALTLYGECRSASLEDMIATGCLIRNRVGLGESWREVCADYDCWSETKRPGNHAKVLAMQEQLLKDAVTDPQYLEAAWVAIGMVHGYCRDVVKGATASHLVSEIPRPEWAQARIPHVQYAKFVCYLPETAA